MQGDGSGGLPSTVRLDTTLFNADTDNPAHGDQAPGLTVNDSADPSQNITATSAYPGFNVADAFGATSSAIEPGDFIFADGGTPDTGTRAPSAGATVDSIGWQTATPVTLSGYQVGLLADQAQTSNRGSEQVSLYYGTGGTAGTVADTFRNDGGWGDITRLFAGGPITGDTFRLELTQATGGGPRVTEIDAITAVTVTVADPGAQFNGVGDTVSVPIDGTDSAGNLLTFSATGLPPGLSIDSSTGAITGTISTAANTASPYRVTVTATDGVSGAAESLPFHWAVIAPATLDPIEDQANVVGDSVSLGGYASVANFGPVSFSASGLPAGLSIDPGTGLISGTISSGADVNSPYSVTVTATENGISSSESFQWSVALLGVDSPGVQSSAEGDNVSLDVNAHNGTGAALTYSATGLPPGLSIDRGTGVISGTVAPGAGAPSPYSVVVTVSDGADSANVAFPWQVGKISLGDPGDQFNYDGGSVSLPTVTHYNGAGSLTFTASGLPDGLTIDSATGTISGTVGPTADQNGPFAVTMTASDGSYSATQSFTWNVAPAVVLGLIPTQRGADGQTVSWQVPAVNELGGSISYSATGLPSGLSINSSTGVISGTIASGAHSSSPDSVTVVASAGSLSATQTFSWVVAQNPPPPGSRTPTFDFNGAPPANTGGIRFGTFHWSHSFRPGVTWSIDLAVGRRIQLTRAVTGQRPFTMTLSVNDSQRVLQNIMRHPNNHRQWFNGVGGTFGFGW